MPSFPSVSGTGVVPGLALLGDLLKIAFRLVMPKIVTICAFLLKAFAVIRIVTWLLA